MSEGVIFSVGGSRSVGWGVQDILHRYNKITRYNAGFKMLILFGPEWYNREWVFIVRKKNKNFVLYIVYVIFSTLYESGNITLVGVEMSLSGEWESNVRGSGKDALDVV